MKKGLLVTTALLGLVVGGQSAMAADKVKLELGGYTKWFVVGAWNNTNYERATGQSFNNVDVKGDSDITFSGMTALDNGLSVGVFTSLRAGTNTGANGWGDDGQNYIDQAFMWIASGYGKVLMGVMPNGALDVQAPDAVGQWNNDGMLTGNAVIQRPEGGLPGTGLLPVLGINGNAINSTKIMVGDSSGKQETVAYVTPTFYGLTAAAAYVPSSAKNVRGPSTTADNSHDVFGLSANYTNTFDDVGVKASAGWARGSLGYNAAGGGAFSGAGQNLQIFNLGLNLSYAGFTVGGSYRQNYHDETAGGLAVGPLGFASFDGNAWDAGIMYATGPWSAGVAYYGSRIKGFSHGNAGQKETVTFVQGSAKYDLGPGVSLQGLVGYGEYKASTDRAGPRPNASKNDGWTVMSGVMVNF